MKGAVSPASAMPNTIENGLIVFSTAVIAVMAVAQTLIFWRQWKAMRDQLNAMQGQLREMETTSRQLDKLIKQAKENTEADQSAARARIDFAFIITRPGGFHYRFAIANHGKSLAIVTSFTFTRASFAKEVTELPDNWQQHPERHNVNNVVSTGDSADLLLFDISIYLSNEERTGEKTAIFAGAVEYLDIFGKPHETESVYSYKPSAGSLENLPRYNRYT